MPAGAAGFVAVVKLTETAVGVPDSVPVLVSSKVRLLFADAYDHVKPDCPVTVTVPAGLAPTLKLDGAVQETPIIGLLLQKSMIIPWIGVEDAGVKVVVYVAAAPGSEVVICKLREVTRPYANASPVNAGNRPTADSTKADTR